MNPNTIARVLACNVRGVPMTPIGGPWWRCEACGGTVRAACECCEPSRCNCRSVRR